MHNRMSNSSQVTADFVKTVTPPENERFKKRTKKWVERSSFGSMGSVRGKVSPLFPIKKYTASEHIEIKPCSQSLE